MFKAKGVNVIAWFSSLGKKINFLALIGRIFDRRHYKLQFTLVIGIGVNISSSQLKQNLFKSKLNHSTVLHLNCEVLLKNSIFSKTF